MSVDPSWASGALCATRALLALVARTGGAPRGHLDGTPSVEGCYAYER